MIIDVVGEILESISFFLVTPQFLPPDRVAHIRARFEALSERFDAYIDKNSIRGPWLPKRASYRFLITMAVFPIGSLAGLYMFAGMGIGIAWILGHPLSQSFAYLRSQGLPNSFPFLLAATLACAAWAVTFLLALAVAVSTEWRLFRAGVALFVISKGIAIYLACLA